MTIEASLNGLHGGREAPHFVMIPLMAQGHMIPATDMARLLASRGARVTLFTTPVNAARIKAIIDRAHQDGLPIQFVELPFPCAEAGLPEGVENIDLVPSNDLFSNFFQATTLLCQPLADCLKELSPRPTCMIYDFCHPWTAAVAQELRIPRLVFHGPSAFFLLCSFNIYRHEIYSRITDESEPFLVPDVPHAIEVTKAQAPGWFHMPGYEDLRRNVNEAEATADGVVVNSFDDLEPEYIERYAKAMGKKVWTIGPLSLYNKDLSSKATRGNKASIDQQQITSWLDSKEPNSVLYVSFGSIARPASSQIMNIGLGLEASGKPFVWVIKEGEKSPEVEKWLAGAFEERTSGWGLIIKGWAPQVVILSHPAVGGFITHCGWNSTLEAVSAGVPMITWPHFADQFLNEMLVVDVLRIGVKIGVKVPMLSLAADEALVKSEEVEKVVRSLMDEGEVGEEMRKRVVELKDKAFKAMEEGGSSYENIGDLIRFARQNEGKDVEK